MAKAKFKEKLQNSKLLEKVKVFAPQVLDVVGDVLPDQGGLGVVKRLIDRDDSISEEDKKVLQEAYQDDLKAFELEVADRDSARSREVELAKVKGTDWMMYATGIVGLLSFVAMVASVIFILFLFFECYPNFRTSATSVSIEGVELCAHYVNLSQIFVA